MKQTRKTLKNVHKFINSKEVVDANSLLRSAFENLIMGIMIYENTSTYKEFINLSIDDKTRQYTKPQKLRNDINMRNRQIMTMVASIHDHDTFIMNIFLK